MKSGVVVHLLFEIEFELEGTPCSNWSLSWKKWDRLLLDEIGIDDWLKVYEKVDLRMLVEEEDSKEGIWRVEKKERRLMELEGEVDLLEVVE